ncbi:MAG: SDR family NAD(P)-dependent oxidoreductase [Planctomycetota bacterium]
MKQLAGRTALVTGAAGGIGRALSVRLAREGCRLVLLDVDQARLEETAHLTQSVDTRLRRCDLSDAAELQAAALFAQAQFAGVDLLVNNAGVGYFGKTEQMAPEHCDRLIDVNLRAPMQLTRALLAGLLARGDAHVLNVASFLGLVAPRRLAAYSATKFGLVGFGESLRAEYGRAGLGVTTLCPGFVDTGMFGVAPHGPDREEAQRPPGWMLTSPEKVAERALRAVQRNQRLVVMQPYAKALFWVKRLAPWAFDLANQSNRRRRAKSVSEPAFEAPVRRAA